MTPPRLLLLLLLLRLLLLWRLWLPPPLLLRLPPAMRQLLIALLRKPGSSARLRLDSAAAVVRCCGPRRDDHLLLALRTQGGQAPTLHPHTDAARRPHHSFPDRLLRCCESGRLPLQLPSRACPQKQRKEVEAAQLRVTCSSEAARAVAFRYALVA